MDKKVSVGGNFTGSINFAMQQNYVPVIRNFVINNETQETLENLELKVTFEPEFAKEYFYQIAEIAAGGSVEITPVRIQLKTEFLFSLTEKMIGTIVIEVLQGEERLYSHEDTIELLAYDQWSGLLFMPEIITAFVTPNYPKVTEVISEASSILKKWTNSPAFTGYQTQNPNNVKYQMAALFSALQNKGIVYQNPPASYEAVGQRVRLPHVVLEQKQGTCLDLAVLYASCLEAVGLHPLLVFVKGHAFAGCWLEEETFADCAVDDVSSIEKRIVNGAEEVLLVECTDYVEGKQVDFDHAVKHGKNHFINPSCFTCVVDVQRSRGSGIRPIPLRLKPTDVYSSDLNKEKAEGLQEYPAPEKLDMSLLGKTAGSSGPITKIKLWERKLLDFSLRNTLLNFRPTRSALQLMTTDLGALEDRLSDGKDLRIMEVPSEWTISLRDAKIFEIENDRDLIQTIASEEFKSNRIRTFLDENELERTLKNLYRSSKVSIEENGANTLFLALGFLRWFESDLSEKARYAPIVLVPIDVVRNARDKGYIIRSRQEDAQINITLLEYIKQDYGIQIMGLDSLPEDEHGINLPLIFHTVRQAVMGKSRWNVEEMAFVGLFSFGQFVMWNDLRSRSSELEENKVVASLINGAMTWQPEKLKVTLDNLDTTLSVKEMAVPLSADSSQLVAVAAAAAGQSFVLHGPPGTGKSQTITNMIANALYQGKSVLFVAEKMAALSVVQRRLADIGLDPFCLELHSNKTNKTAVLAELDKALEVGRIKPPEEYEVTAAKVHELRAKLNDIIDAVHCKRSYGISLYDAAELFEQNLSQKGVVDFSRELLEDIDKDAIEKWNEVLRAFGVAIGELGEYNRHPLKGYEGLLYSIELREQFAKDSEYLTKMHQETYDAYLALSDWFGLTGKDKCTVEAAVAAANAVIMPAVTLPKTLRSANYDGVMQQMRLLLQNGKEYAALQEFLENQFEASVLEYPFEAARLRWKQAEGSWFLAKILKQNKLVKELRLYAKSQTGVTKENITSIYEKLSTLTADKKMILEMPTELTGLCNGLFMGLQTDWESLENAIAKTEQIYTAMKPLDCLEKENMLSELEKDKNTENVPVLCRTVSAYLKKISETVNTYVISTAEIDKASDYLRAVQDMFVTYAENISQLRSMVSFNQADKAAREAGLVNISDAFKSGKINAENLQVAFSCNLYYQLTLKTIGEDSRLSDFHGKQYDDLIAQYHEAIDKYQRLTIQELVATLSAKVPSSGTESAAASEMGILKRAIKSNGRRLSLRKLFDQIPTLLRKLCPCMLMSPISVAQYIDPSFPKFDLVIFDEASQLPTSEAVGTIARGENAVIVGDPKQLPPTSFFSSNRIDEENSEKEDLESLLDDCLAISMPQEYLKWHYRSRHESLIAYSNRTYYDNKLYTFPSPRDLVSEVKLVHVDGMYDKGKTKQNKAEAEAIVKEIVRRLRDEKLRQDSIGVVTFSSVQQNLIDDMLMEEFNKNPELDEIDKNAKEPVFIKNLENVQGDERDIILFSIGYGPDANGNVSMNFGPLNRDGGWRRLNVAISRARKQMIVYAVIRPDQINLARTRSEGVAGLKGFLEFAERGKNVLPQNASAVKAREDYLVSEIAEEIKKLGYDVRCNVGCSEYKIDIGIVNAKTPDTYLLGILLDGENCNAAATARDRFVLQPKVLNGLGWKVMRIWTLDWLDDSQSVMETIKRAVAQAIAEEENPAAESAGEDPFKPDFIEFEREEEKPEKPASVPYHSVTLPVIGTAEMFYLPENTRKIVNVINTILIQEAPISQKALMKKVLACFGISRGGSRVESIFLSALSRVDKKQTQEEDRIFLWKPEQNPKEYSIYRVENQNGNKRSMEDIPTEEIQAAMLEVLTEQIGLSEIDLIRETAKKFEFTRLGNVIDTTVRYTIKRAIGNGIIGRLDNGNIVIKE